MSYGELLSSQIIAQHLNEQGVPTTWKDSRELIRTNSNFGNAAVDFVDDALRAAEATAADAVAVSDHGAAVGAVIDERSLLLPVVGAVAFLAAGYRVPISAALLAVDGEQAREARAAGLWLPLNPGQKGVSPAILDVLALTVLWAHAA